MRRLKVVHACDWHLKYATQLARGMADIGMDVTLLTRTHDQEFGNVPGKMREYISLTTEGLVEHQMLPGRARDLAHLPAVMRQRRTLRRHGIDVVHYQETVGTDARLMLAAGLRKPFALTIHDPVPHPGDHWPLGRRLGLRLLARQAGVVFVHSETLREEVAEDVGVRGPVVVVPHGMATPRVAPLPDRPRLLFFGRIATYYKGLDVLLDTMPLVWQQLPELELLIAGSGDCDPHPVLEDPRVELRNEHVPDAEIPAIFAASTCCVLPYRQASQSGVGSHAKTYGRAIIASDVGGLPDLVGPDAGRLVPPGDVEALARAIVEVVGTPGLAASMSTAAERWADEARWDRVAERTVQAYERHLLAPAHRAR